MATNPMHQFTVYRIGPEINLGSVNLSFSNATLFMAISALTILFLLFIGTKKKLLIPSKMQLVTELSYHFIAKMINETAGKNARSFFPIIFNLFMLVLFCMPIPEPIGAAKGIIAQAPTSSNFFASIGSSVH